MKNKIKSTEIRKKALEATSVLDLILVDILTCTNILRIFDKPFFSRKFSPIMAAGIHRMCLWYLFLALCRWYEFYIRYKKILPAGSVAICRDLSNEIQKRGIIGFRNKVIGHIWDNEAECPLSDKEVSEYIRRIAKDDFTSFYQWIIDFKENIYPKTVVSIVETLRDKIMEQNSISSEELGLKHLLTKNTAFSELKE
jgi:hypothetical protein